MPTASVSEVHAYPLRPEGFEEPLFPTPASKRAVAEHLLRAPWLARASEIEGQLSGQLAHVVQEPIELRRSRGKTVQVVRLRNGKRRAWKRRRVMEVLARWREVGWWWDEGRKMERTVVRVLLHGGAVVDLAREGSGWFLVGVAD
ncbi:MAG: hypothetical protein M3316_01035 [Actinomycetota bacterium]|nr:hypothetical protein [Actinomycetota bacterium]